MIIALKKVLSICFLLLSVVGLTQQDVLLQNGEWSYFVESQVYQTDSNVHTSVQPYQVPELNQMGVSTTLESDFFLDKIISKSRKNSNGFALAPLISGIGTFQMPEGEVLGMYGAGLLMQGHFGSKFSYSGFGRAVGEKLPNYLSQSVYSREVIPSVARATDTTAMKNGFHWGGNLSYTPNQYFNFMLGNGKHFWGDGYRSLLLSDNASNYPYFRIASTFWKVKYINLYSWHKDYYSMDNANKFSAAHMLSWNITKNLNLGLFEAVIWQGQDTLHNRGFDVGYLNPAIFYRSVEYSRGSSDNSLLGANIKWEIDDKYVLYGQVILDEFLLEEIRAGNQWWANKQGGQLGIKTFDFLGVKGLGVQTEFNLVRPFTYSHLTSLQNYAHNQQSLAHPVGSNFRESVSFIRYQKNNWYFEEQFNFLTVGLDSSSISYGGDMFVSYVQRDGEYGHEIGQGETHKVFYNSIKASYLLVKELNMRAFGQVIYRRDRYNDLANNTVLFRFGVSTDLWNQYRDF